TRLLNAAVAKIFGGSLPEKIARCLGFYLKYKASFCSTDRGFVFRVYASRTEFEAICQVRSHFRSFN
ncbi:MULTISPECIES: hypothetical protein, partial [unclassified Microcoleus]|uniref:hypothetical protein n=1 Tax=unclassified Microcoleus TaxID=2642155 RepID=UPI002FD0FB1F